MRRLLGTLIAALAFANAAFAVDWDIHDINVNVRLYRDGSAIVSEVWNMTLGEGTEVYVQRDNLGDIEISDLSVTDETGTMYTFEKRWDTDRSRAAKAGRCGFNRISGGVELCWGIGDYGTHEYSIRYKMTNLVKSLNDYDMIHFKFVDESDGRPEHVKVTFETQNAPMDTSWVRIWGFGFRGADYFEDGKVIYESTEQFRYNSSVIALMRFDKGVFDSESVQDKDFQKVLDRAMKGSEYSDGTKTWKEKLAGFLSSMLALLIVLLPVIGLARSGRLSRRQKRKILDGPADKVAWYRDLPFQGDIYKTDYVLDLFETKRQSNSVVSAMILRMIERGYLLVGKGEKGKIEISFNEALDTTQLDKHELGLYDMMKQASGADLVLQDKEFSRWSQRSRNQNTVRLWANGLEMDAKRELREENYVTGTKFSEKGKTEAQRVIGFKNFLNDFTISSERESVEVGLWKDYLVYAALYGIADKVAKELKDIDPKVFEEVMANDYTMFNDIVRMTNTLSRSLTAAQYAAQSSPAGSRGSFRGFGGGTSFGGGGGFSGGGHAGVR